MRLLFGGWQKLLYYIDLLNYIMSSYFVIKGGNSLRGEVRVRGSKNAATKMMVASLLTEEPCVIENIPHSADIDITRELLLQTGSSIFFDDKGDLHIQTAKIQNAIVPQLSRRNRIPILALGPLLHRKGVAEVPVLGGCPIGHRPINFHVDALSKMGVRIERREHSYFAEARDIHGAEIELPYPSVGATENVLLTAVLARGRTVLKNAALEPEILNLVEMLGDMGSSIRVFPEERRFEIDGVLRLKGVRVKVIPDRNEIVSFASAALATDGEIFIPEIRTDDLTKFFEAVDALGGVHEISGAGVHFRGKRPYRALNIETAPHPAFMTDWQQPLSVILTQAQGESIIHETVYEDRFGYIADLKRMGAKIEVSDECPPRSSCRFFGMGFRHTARIKGPSQLRGEEIEVSDIRAGMAHIIAALTAEGESVITGIEHIDRGYERIDERLRGLGADIQRIAR